MIHLSEVDRRRQERAGGSFGRRTNVIPFDTCIQGDVLFSHKLHRNLWVLPFISHPATGQGKLRICSVQVSRSREVPKGRRGNTLP